MPTGTRLSTPIPRSYLTDVRLASVRSPLARESFFRMKLIADNLGRLPGSEGMVGGLLYPAGAPAPSAMKSALKDLERADLIFRYQVGAAFFIEICDTGLTQHLIGNMARRSEYPAPPKKMIEAWQRRTGLQWRAICDSQTRTNVVQTASEPSANGVRTR
jgi:hypothetical protein